MQTKFEFSAGALVRGQIKRELERAAFDAGVDVKIQSFGGWLSTDYGVTVSGDEKKVQAYTATVTDWMKQIGS